MRLSRTGLALALLYVLIVVLVAASEFNCGGGLDINFCGVGTFLLTLPSQTAIGRLFSKMGLEIDFGHRTPSASDLAQLAAHIAICASIVYVVGYGLEKLVSSCVGFFRRSSS